MSEGGRIKKQNKSVLFFALFCPFPPKTSVMLYRLQQKVALTYKLAPYTTCRVAIGHPMD